jgi:uncharacterized protein (DUF58 family)
LPLPSPIAALLPWRRSPARPAPPERPRLPADLARKVRRIEIATQRLVAQGVAGEYHSVFKGRGVEFAEVRPYQPGDDVRAIDWNVTARMGEPYVKTYVEERDLAVFLAIDVSGSQSFGSRAIVKRDLAAEVAALLAFAAVSNGDRVGAALLSDRMELYLAPARRRTHVLRLIREVLIRPAGGGTDLGAGLTQVLATAKRSSVLFLISDFLCPPFPRALQAAAARHDLVVIEIVDPRDARLPEVGPVPLTDAETGRTALVDGSRRAAEHAERSRSERHELRRTLRRLGVDHLVLRTDRPYLGPMVAFFEDRRRRLAR